MIVYLVRHGIAEDPRPGQTDRDRRLTPRGRARMRRAARGFAALVGTVDAIYTSPYPRASETARLLAAALRKAPKPEPLQDLVPDASPVEALRTLRAVAPVERLVCVGHEPLFSSLAALLLTGSVDGMRIDLKKGGCIAIALRTPAPRTATLAWVVTPRQLRRIGRGHADVSG
jgi:phosphohistidine phosphatase